MNREKEYIRWASDHTGNTLTSRISHIYKKLLYSLRLNETAVIQGINTLNGEIIETIVVKKERVIVRNKSLILIIEKERRTSESWKKRKEQNNGQLSLF